MSTIKLMHAKIHRVRVTEAKRDYVGSITIDADLLEKSGILPLEEVEIVNVSNGNRLSTYVLPGEPKSGIICPNGGAALLCKTGDILILWANEQCERADVQANGHKAKVVLADEHNRCQELIYQTLTPGQEGVEFRSRLMLPEGQTSEYLEKMVGTK